ncbi:hypothetical protein GCM10010172_56670 [Paractinoplanes ferrugineus]|uniref:Uncharacterized protein n=1 Tax=Paractinoplanes ferrugineus TaxID=113564 RepID=A0A919MCL1_9ACTN|nr:hypothetical protein [Actinoplanes ferrugineus]GIE10863.1 hypothetical protein Afe05nite_27030 [Actinoplanes ferrugineus]
MMVAASNREPRRPWLAPAAVLRRIGEMRAAGGGRAAERLLDAIGAGRAAHEVAGIVEALDATGATADADRVLTAVCRRSPAEVAAMLTVLRTLRRDAVLTRVRAHAATELDTGTIAAIAALLAPAERAALTAAVLAARLRPESDGSPASSARPDLAGGAAARLTRLETTDPAAAAGLAEAVLDEGPAETARALAGLADAPLRQLLHRLGTRPAAEAALVMAELVGQGQRSLSRAVAAAVPGGVDWPAETDVRVVIDLMVASAEHGAALAAVVDAAGPRGFVEALAAEPAGVIAAVLTRAYAAGARELAGEILDDLARRPGTVKWIARLWHLDPEPAASAGRRPDLVDRYLDLVVGLRTPQQVADLIRELDDGDGAPMAGRITRMLLDDPARRWVRPYVGHLLGDSPRADVLCGGWTGDRAELARAAAVDELRRRLPEPAPVHSWRPALSLRAAERPLWLVRLGDLDGGSLIGLSDRGVHCHSAPGPLSGPRIRQPGREFRIDYEQFADLTFAFVEEGRRIRIAKADTSYYWAADHAAGAEARAVTALLNAVAAAVRAIYAVRIDEPLGPSPG